jgi:hypothetical protein
MIGSMGASEVDERFRCSACGNLTRFDVTVSRRVKEFRHFSVGGDLTVESAEILEETVERIECRWCSASGDSIERLAEDATGGPTESDAGAA